MAAGLPIATGVVEGACRHLVKDRMDITGARWGLDQAEAIRKLRSLKVSGDLEAYRTFHFRREHERHYPRAPIPELGIWKLLNYAICARFLVLVFVLMEDA